MSHRYQAVGWNPQKRRYDLIAVTGAVAVIALGVAAGLWRDPDATAETLLIRSLGLTALLLLHVVLAIGPLCRLDRRWLPLLYNRRHLGVLMCLLALAHGIFSTIQFHAFGELNPVLSVLVSDGDFRDAARIPFQPLGAIALSILLVMAATSHDFWLSQLGPRVWKWLHMSVYGAYLLLVAHVLFGSLRGEGATGLGLLLAAGFVGLAALHLAAALRERRTDRAVAGRSEEGWIDVGLAADIPLDRARAAVINGERVAVFRHAGGISCVAGVCRHQQGPLAEGRIIGGCITCPWHGYQYAPDTGQAPPPFDDKIATYRVRVRQGRVLVDPVANPPGTPVPPAAL